MPSKRQSVVVQLQRRGMTPGQIALALGIPRHRVYMLGYHGRRKIKKTILSMPPEIRVAAAEEVAQLCGA